MANDVSARGEARRSRELPSEGATAKAVTASPDACDLDPLNQAVAEVDRSLPRWSLGLTPRERLRAAVRAGRAISKLRRGVT